MGQLHQKELFRTSVLAKLRGCLVLIKVNPFTPKGFSGQCPACKSNEFTEAESGWTECNNDECDFAILTAHLKEIENQ